MGLFFEETPVNRRKFLPPTVDELIDHLDTLYPARCIFPGESFEEAHRRAGQREVVQYLRDLQAKESSDELEAHKRF